MTSLKPAVKVNSCSGIKEITSKNYAKHKTDSIKDYRSHSNFGEVLRQDSSQGKLALLFHFISSPPLDFHWWCKKFIWKLEFHFSVFILTSWNYEESEIMMVNFSHTHKSPLLKEFHVLSYKCIYCSTAAAFVIEISLSVSLCFWTKK